MKNTLIVACMFITSLFLLIGHPIILFVFSIVYVALTIITLDYRPFMRIELETVIVAILSINLVIVANNIHYMLNPLAAIFLYVVYGIIYSVIDDTVLELKAKKKTESLKLIEAHMKWWQRFIFKAFY